MQISATVPQHQKQNGCLQFSVAVKNSNKNLKKNIPWPTKDKTCASVHRCCCNWKSSLGLNFVDSLRIMLYFKDGGLF